MGVSHGSILGPLLFLIHINDLPPTINSQSKHLLFADDTNIIIIISHPEINCFQICMNDVFAGLNKWIKAHKFTLNFDKTNFMKFCTTNKNCVNLTIGQWRM
jgi:hypothetical protein